MKTQRHIRRTFLTLALAAVIAVSLDGCTEFAAFARGATTSVAAIATSVPAAPPTPAAATTAAATTVARVVDIVDGDTIKVLIGDQTYTVRYIGIDTPETVHPTKGVEPFGKEATAVNTRLVKDQAVRLEKDVSETDQYGRLLRYVYVGDLMVNAELVRLGYAHASSYPPDVRYQALFGALQREAAAAGRGLWSQAAAVTANAPTPSRTETPGIFGGTCAGCIKGNISTSGEKIYHAPGCPDYDRTVVSESRGERYFSSESEALAAGWRKAKNCP